MDRGQAPARPTHILAARCLLPPPPSFRRARARRSRGVGDDTPFQVARLADGRLILRDLGTGQVIELRSFGPTNEGAFAALLDARVTDPAQAPPVTATQTRQPL